jgi:hypothetical protein
MLKVATFSGFPFCAIGGIAPALAQNARTGTHYVGDVGAIKSPGHPPLYVAEKVIHKTLAGTSTLV